MQAVTQTAVRHDHAGTCEAEPVGKFSPAWCCNRLLQLLALLAFVPKAEERNAVLVGLCLQVSEVESAQQNGQTSAHAVPAEQHQQTPCNTSFGQLDSEQQVQCGRKLLARAMLGEPLYEKETEEVSEMQVQTAGDSLQPRSSQESDASTASSSSGAFVAAALGDGNVDSGSAQHAQHGDHGLNADASVSGRGASTGFTGGSASTSPHLHQAQHTQQAQQASRPYTRSATTQSQHTQPPTGQSPGDTREVSNQEQRHAEPAVTPDFSQHARNLVDSCRQAAPGCASSSIAKGGKEQDREGGGRPWLKRAFSMVERENLNVDYESMDSLVKVRTSHTHTHCLSLHTHQVPLFCSQKAQSSFMCCVSATIS